MTKIDDAGSPVVDVAYKTAAGKTRVMPWNATTAAPTSSARPRSPGSQGVQESMITNMQELPVTLHIRFGRIAA
jgi:hypothetical protein